MSITRTSEILAAVDNLLEVHDEWERDEKTPVQPTEAFEMAVDHVVAVADGDIPSHCRDLCMAVAKLGVEWEKYKNGARTKDYRPIGSFWESFRNVIATRAVAEPREYPRPEPVRTLLEQKVTYGQIARHIWGHAGKGPFLTAGGQVQIDKLMEERDEPGKHTKGWIHPESIQRQRDAERALQRRLGAVANKESHDSKTIEKATVVELLKEGQYPDVIARVKGVSIEGVLEEAKRYGIKPNVRPNLAATRGLHDPEITSNDSDAFQGLNSVNPIETALAHALPEDDGQIIDDADEETDQESDESLIQSLNDGTRGTAEIIAEGKSRGRKWSQKTVKEALSPANT